MNWSDDVLMNLRAAAPEIAWKLVLAVLILIGGLIVGRLLGRIAGAAVARQPRGQTLSPLIRSIVRIAIFGTAVVMALDQLGLPIATVLAGAGVIGLAIGFGAQALVKDVISGFFHIVEGVIAVGDVAQVGDVTGLVEEVGLRITKVRAFNGQLWHIPNGAIDRVGNYNRGWCRAVVEVSVAYEHDARKALAVIKGIGDAYRAEHPTMVLEDPEAQGAMGLNASDVTVRLVLKVKPQEHWAIERELRLRVKEALDAAGIEIPFPRRVVYHRQEDGRPLQVLSNSGT